MSSIAAFKRVLSAFRVVLRSEFGNDSFYNPGQLIHNGDLSCDEFGALYVRDVSSQSGGNSGSGVESQTFNSYSFVARPVRQFRIINPLDVGIKRRLQVINAVSSSRCYLQIHVNNNDPPDPVQPGDLALYEWACPFETGVQVHIQHPWGLVIPDAVGIWAVFSHSMGVYDSSNNCRGHVHGIHTYNMPP